VLIHTRPLQSLQL